MTPLKDFRGTNTRYVGTSRITLYSYDIVHKSLPHCYRTAVGVCRVEDLFFGNFIFEFDTCSSACYYAMPLLVFNMYCSYEPQSRKHYELQRYAARSTVMPHNEGRAPSGPST